MTCVGVGVEKYQDGGTKKQINICNLKGKPRLCSQDLWITPAGCMWACYRANCSSFSGVLTRSFTETKTPESKSNIGCADSQVRDKTQLAIKG